MAEYSPEEASRRRKGIAMLAMSGLVLVGSLGLLVFQFGLVSFSWPGWVAWPDWLGGGGGREVVRYQRVNVDQPTPAPVPPSVGLAAAQLAELRRVQDEHLQLIASIPPTATPAPPELVNPDLIEERRREAVARVRRHPEGVPATPRPAEDWFDPQRGLYFRQDNGGDWTLSSVAEDNPYGDLFYYEYYPDAVDNFADGSIYRSLAQSMAFEAVELLPPLVEVTPDLIDLMTRRVGWQLREGSEPIVNVWTTFSFNDQGTVREYSVGGVMRMAVRSWEDNGRVWEYVEVGDWIRPVALERVR